MIYKRIISYYKQYTSRLVGFAICIILGSILFAASRKLIQPLIDYVFIEKDMNMLFITIGSIIAVFFLLGILVYSKNYLAAYLAQRITMNLRNQIYAHLETLSLDFYSRVPTGEIMSNFTNDIGLLQGMLSKAPVTLIGDGFSILCLLALLLSLHWKLAIICIAAFGVSIFPIRVFSYKMRYLSINVQEQIARLYSYLQESILGINVTKAFNREKTEIERFAKVNKGFYDLMMRFSRVEARNSPIMEFIGSLAISVIIYIAAKDVIDGKWTTGAFFAFVGVALSIAQLIRNIVQINPMIQQAASASERIFNLLGQKSTVIELPDAYPLLPFKNEIRYENVSFRYKPGQSVLKNINLTVKSNEVIGIVGPSGSGKTTLLHLLLRFYDPSEGKILIDGNDIKKVSLASLREQIGIVTQDTVLFNESVKYNIGYGKINATEEEIVNAGIAANADQFIRKMPGGYDTIVGEKGSQLSGGEKQRIAIARAIIKNPAILILDEATSALDAESEKYVQDAVEKIMAKKTVLLIAHRLATVKKCSRIVVIENGMIVDIGTHDELFKKEGLYKKLHHLQLV